MLSINGRRSDELPTVALQAPEITKGADFDQDMDEEYKWVRFPFYVKGSHLTSAYVGHNTDTDYTKLQLGKHCKIVRDKKIGDPTLWPLGLQCSMDGVTVNAEVTYDSSKKEYNLKINGQPYSDIPKRTDFAEEPE